MKNMSYLLCAIFTILLGCNIDDKIHRESRNIQQAKENELLIAQVQSFNKIEKDDNEKLIITKLSGWIEYQPKYLGEKLESVDKTHCNLILNIDFDERSDLNLKNFNENYGLFYDSQYMGKSYAGFTFSLNKLLIPNLINIELRKFNKRYQINNYKVIGSLTLKLNKTRL